MRNDVENALKFIERSLEVCEQAKREKLLNFHFSSELVRCQKNYLHQQNLRADVGNDEKGINNFDYSDDSFLPSS